ncbi:MAG: ABC transporter ATP-binding protein [Candidatus Binatia bacterium]
MTSAAATVPAPLAVRGVSKRFGATQALIDVSLEFRPGEIHAILGENGAGKSTLMHILAGIQRADTGSVVLDGRPSSFATPRDARNAGVGMVHQHFALVEALTVAENLALALPRRSRWRLDRAAIAAEAGALARRVGLALGRTDIPVSRLPVGARQRLEILNALAHARRVLILDEPTAVLTPREVHPLFAMVRQLRDDGRLVLFITHKLREVRELADRVTIMRRGRVVGTFPAARLGEREMAERMIGDMAPGQPRAAARAAGTVALNVSALAAIDARRGHVLTDVNLSVRAGEILGIAGVDGNGQQELFEVLVGLRPPAHGTVQVRGKRLADFTPAAAVAAGIGHVPPDRQHEGLVLPMTLADNLLLSRALLDRCSRHGLLDIPAARRLAAAAVSRYGIRASLDDAVRSLSGGNQQRVLVARALAQDPAVLVAVNPCRGLDVAAARAVADALLDSARRGCAVLLISTDLDEVVELSDRIGVMSCGRLSPVLESPFDVERLGMLMAGTPS